MRQRISFPFSATAAFVSVFAALLVSVMCGVGAGRACAAEGSKAAIRTHLLFCNEPEKLRMAGACADARLESGHTYTIFYHFRNVSRSAGPFVVALHGMNGGEPLRFSARRGTGDPRRDPSLAGRQAMARYLSSAEQPMLGRKGWARFASVLRPSHVASGVLTVRCESDARLRIYFRHDKWTLPRASVVLVDAPRREFDVALSPFAKRQTIRIGDPEPGMHPKFDGTYGVLYAFRIAAPPGRKVRVSFSPRGGKGGLVGSINGTIRQTRIVRGASWGVFCESQTGRNGEVNLTTAPFGGVFYPVELVFQLL
jgi:hypothetical protein